MFYVYEVSIVATGEIIYVGKGTGNRYKTKKKNKLLNRLIEDNECDFKKTMYFETEEEAFEAERQRIIELKAIGQAVCNKAINLSGGISSYWTEERRKEQSVNNPMKDPKQRERMSLLNPMKNKDVAKRVAEKNKMSFKIGDRSYVGLDEAANEYGVTTSCICYWLNRGYDRNGEKCYRTKSVEEIQISTIENNHTIMYGEEEYTTIKDLCNAVGKTQPTISGWLRRGFSPDGTPCRYKDDTTERQFIKKEHYAFPKKSIMVDGIKYESIAEASRHTGYSTKKLSYYLNQATNPPVKCEYVNQQPSHTKSDNSSVEGSTTNG